MAKFKVLKVFRDIETKEVYEVNQEIDLTVKRAKEVVENLDDSFLEKVKPAEEKEADVGEEKVEPAESAEEKTSKKK